jgi:hypothetical protein
MFGITIIYVDVKNLAFDECLTTHENISAAKALHSSIYIIILFQLTKYCSLTSAGNIRTAVKLWRPHVSTSDDFESHRKSPLNRREYVPDAYNDTNSITQPSSISYQSSSFPKLFHPVFYFLLFPAALPSGE